MTLKTAPSVMPLPWQKALGSPSFLKDKIQMGLSLTLGPGPPCSIQPSAFPPCLPHASPQPAPPPTVACILPHLAWQVHALGLSKYYCVIIMQLLMSDPPNNSLQIVKTVMYSISHISWRGKLLFLPGSSRKNEKYFPTASCLPPLREGHWAFVSRKSDFP